ncbi:hypothetical protein L207DRAFT_559914 [Hyaloscypha variabilis F]|uniref:Uncharacterized protein n=1 Tax=Hyaloscypha variabilis (strain UAMH 11265 / GT02V1 / F) TaxID=1149755 RepID=A0A2J6SBR9_HYAVF|nr:hypothetical protein L207DRAFT_559914 [Hyaloscypha variabilis F]
MKLNNPTLVLSFLLSLLSRASPQGIYHPPSPNFLLECIKGRSAQGCFSAYGTYCDKNGFIRNPKPGSRTECVGQTRGWCFCSRVADDILENPYYKWPPQDTDMSGPFGPGGVSGTSASGAPYGYMAWESFKLKKGSNSTNSTNATYAGPAPLLVLHDSGANVRASPGYGLLAMALGAVLCGLVPTWGMLLVMVPAVMPQAAAEAYVGPYMAADSMR